MAKKFECKDTGMQCEFSAEAESEEELMPKILEHTKSAHNMEHIDEPTMAKLRASIKDA
ncbi:MAG: DUF1059 domain-containing protein [Candidatus Marsarchaeota archaeon]|jgi:predicted small metal-binding protein|nr:DUF1059 domain-containing protein [Candidatus Marsarchaeota archaeon]